LLHVQASLTCHLEYANYQRLPLDLGFCKPGQKGTQKVGEINTNLHANLQSMRSSKRDQNLRILKLPSNAKALSKK